MNFVGSEIGNGPNYSHVACCLCGMSMIYNQSGMCQDCLATKVDITEGMDKHAVLIQCGKCDRWHIDLDRWTHHEMESAGLLSLCLKRMKLPNECKVKDAMFIWTEPHSKRIKVQADIEKEVMDGKVVLGSKLLVEFKIVAKQCMECIREATDHTWGAQIQIRQRVGHKRSFFQLERLLIESNMHNLMTGVVIVREGMDLYFKTKNQADRVVDIISSALPTTKSHSRKLVSQDKKSNTSKYELTTLLEVAPLCKNDLVLLPRSFTGSAEFMIITKLQSSIHMINPTSLATLEVKCTKYFQSPFQSLLSIQNLVTFVVLDITPVSSDGKSLTMTPSQYMTGGVLAEAEVARETDLGDNDTTFRVLTHLGHILQPGDTCLGYLLKFTTDVPEELYETLAFQPPDVILVRKTYPEKTKRKSNKKKVSGHWLPVEKTGKVNHNGGSEDDAAFLLQLEDEQALAEELGVAVEALVGAAHIGFVGAQFEVEQENVDAYAKEEVDTGN